MIVEDTTITLAQVALAKSIAKQAMKAYEKDDMYLIPIHPSTLCKLKYTRIRHVSKGFRKTKRFM